MPKLTSMVNIGKAMAEKLTAVGIDFSEGLASLGAEEAFLRLKAAYPQICLVYLYTLEGAIRGIPFHHLPENRKRELKAFYDSLKASQSDLPPKWHRPS